jgi:hypothetical protein
MVKDAIRPVYLIIIEGFVMFLNDTLVLMA